MPHPCGIGLLWVPIIAPAGKAGRGHCIAKKRPVHPDRFLRVFVDGGSRGQQGRPQSSQNNAGEQAFSYFDGFHRSTSGKEEALLIA